MTARLYRFALPLAVATAAFASGTTAWEMSSYADFIRGNFDGISLSRDGRITLGPKIDPIFTSDQPVVWAAAEAPDGTLYAATGNRGRVYKIDRSGKSSLLWTAPEPEVFAIAVGKDGAVYAGTSPDGKVYRIENGTATEYFAPQARYIWSLASAPRIRTPRSMWAQATRAKSSAWIPAGKGEVYYDTGQSHITGLAVDSQGRLLAGTEPNGILYRISAKDKAFVLYDANLPEIRAIVPMPDGTVYAAALGGSVAKQAQAAAQAAQNNNVVTAPGTTITVSVDAAAANARRDQAAGHQTAAARHAAAPQVTQHAFPPSRIPATSTNRPSTASIRITRWRRCGVRRKKTSTTCWRWKSRFCFPPIRTAASMASRPTAASPWSRRPTKAKPSACCPPTTRFWPPPATWAASSAWAKRPGASGTYEAPVHDSGTASHWGSLSWRADLPAGREDRVPHALRQLRQARPHLERLVRSAHRSQRLAHRQPQRALHPMEAGNDRRPAE